ncbi:MAG: helix-turn-helix domain-containing protein [Lachnospiraceae bacterium]|nr:helix-turn-helix domain-containing protein [Lachnospiraceae bacterium]
MDFSEKLLTLRKARDLTQEELAEKLNVSRQSVSKWESGQAVPELDKIVALSTVFDVTTDYLLKSSEIDDLSVKTEMLEKQQQQMLLREQRQQKIRECILYGIVVYLILLAVCFVEHNFFWEWDIWSPSIFMAEFLTATAVVVFVCARTFRSEKQ